MYRKKISLLLWRKKLHHFCWNIKHEYNRVPFFLYWGNICVCVYVLLVVKYTRNVIVENWEERTRTISSAPLRIAKEILLVRSLTPTILVFVCSLFIRGIIRDSRGKISRKGFSHESLEREAMSRRAQERWQSEWFSLLLNIYIIVQLKRKCTKKGLKYWRKSPKKGKEKFFFL